RCERFDRPSDLSSCDTGSEIFEVARSVPRGLVDVIAAGHTHGAVAHQVNGIGIVQPFSHGRAFGRIDLVFDRQARRVARIQQFPPTQVCAEQEHSTGNCVPGATPAAPTQYEGRHVAFDPAIVQAMAPALERVRRLQATAIGGALPGPLRRAGDFGSPLGDVFADAMRAAVPAADVAVINNSTRGLRADISAGPITFGRLYDVFPFDNRIARVALGGGDLRRWLAREIQQNRRGGLGISGVSVHASCLPDGIHVDLLRAVGPPIQDTDRLLVVTIGYPTPSGGVAGAAPDGFASIGNMPVVREVVEDWWRRQARPMPGSLEHADRRLELAGRQTAACIDPH
ncbi:MAG: 5'-nucleotidase C-terminal domain-containing protein, partial [Vicinamibacterales bacterium]